MKASFSSSRYFLTVKEYENLGLRVEEADLGFSVDLFDKEIYSIAKGYVVPSIIVKPSVRHINVLERDTCDLIIDYLPLLELGLLLLIPIHIFTVLKFVSSPGLPGLHKLTLVEHVLEEGVHKLQSVVAGVEILEYVVMAIGLALHKIPVLIDFEVLVVLDILLGNVLFALVMPMGASLLLFVLL